MHFQGQDGIDVEAGRDIRFSADKDFIATATELTNGDVRIQVRLMGFVS